MGWVWIWATTAGEEPAETPMEYCKKIWIFIGYAFAHICIGAANVLTLAYALATKDLHAFLCTVGWQFFVAEGILMVCYTYCNPIYKHHRKVVHMFLMILGIIFICSGSVLILYIVSILGALKTPHGLIGFGAFVLTIITSLIGPFAAAKYEWSKALHGVFALPTYVVATLCLITGIFTSAFKNYVRGVSVVILMTVLILFYSVFIFIVALICVLCRLRKVFKNKPNEGTSA